MRGKRWRLCEGCDGRVAITFHEVVADPLGRSAVTEIIRSWVASSGAGETRKQQTNNQKKLINFGLVFLYLFVCFPAHAVGGPLVSCESLCKTSRWAVKVHGIVLLLIDWLIETDQETEHRFPLSAIPASPGCLRSRPGRVSARRGLRLIPRSHSRAV